MKRVLLSILTALLLTNTGTALAQSEAKKGQLEVNFFYSVTCPHCKAEQEFLDIIENKYPQIMVNRYEVSDETHYNLLFKLAEEHDAERYLGIVPLTFIGEGFFVGFDNAEGMGAQIESSILRQMKPANQENPEKPQNNLTLPFIGEINPENYSLPVLAVTLGTLDGFNVCSLGALVLILGLALALQSRRKILIFGGIFIATTAIIYGILIFLWYQLFSILAAYTRGMEILIGLLALVGGVYFLKEFNRFRKQGPTCELSASKLITRLSKKVESVFGGTGSLLAISASIITFAAVITIVEFPCSAAIPVIFAGIMANAKLPSLIYFLYITLFLIFYMLDEIIVFLIAVFTMKLWFSSPKITTWIVLIEGLLLLSLGLYYLF